MFYIWNSWILAIFIFRIFQCIVNYHCTDQPKNCSGILNYKRETQMPEPSNGIIDKIKFQNEFKIVSSTLRAETNARVTWKRFSWKRHIIILIATCATADARLTVFPRTIGCFRYSYIAATNGKNNVIELTNAVHHNALNKKSWVSVARGEGGQEHVRATLSFVNKIALSGAFRFPILTATCVDYRYVGKTLIRYATIKF